jgi:hypothetical protein
MRPLPRRVRRRTEGCLNALPDKWSEPAEPPRRLCGSTMVLVRFDDAVVYGVQEP